MRPTLRLVITILSLLVNATLGDRGIPPTPAPLKNNVARMASLAATATPSPAASPTPSNPPEQAQLTKGATILGSTIMVTGTTQPGLIQPYHNSTSATTQGRHVKAFQNANGTESEEGGSGGGEGDGEENKGGQGGGGGGDSLQSLASVSLPLSITAIIGLSVGSVACAALLGVILYAFVRCCCAGKKPKRNNAHAVLHSNEELNEAHAEGAQGAEPLLSSSQGMEEANAVTSSQPIVPLEASDNLALPSKSLNELDAQAASSQPSAPNAELITVSKQGELVPVATSK